MSFRHFLARCVNLIVLATAAPYVVVGSSSEIHTTTQIESPSGNLAAHCLTGDQVAPAVGRIEIIEKHSGAILFAQEVNPPLYALKWTGDSKTLISVQHVAGGSVAQIMHFSSKKWDTFQAEPQMAGKATVIACRPTQHTVELSYKIIQQTDGEGKQRYIVNTFTVDPNTGAHTGETNREIDAETYRSLRLE